MSDKDTTATSTATEDWNAIVGGGGAAAASPTAAAASAPAAAPANLPELPEIIGRLPIRCDTKVAIIQLPQPTKGVHCAAVFANSTVLSECDSPASDVCRPAVKYARPLNDKEIEVVFWGNNDGKVTGLGWKEAAYPGGQLETRPVPVGVPIVEIKLVAGRTIDCGCDGENWASDDWQA